MDKLASFEIFIRAAELGSFTAVSESLRMSPQLVGKYVADLESFLNVRLINRTTRQQNLTDAGIKFYPRAKKILQDLKVAQAELNSEPSGSSGLLRICIPSDFCTSLIPVRINEYLQCYPEVRIEVIPSSRKVDIDAEGIDAVFGFGEPSDPSLITVPLTSAVSLVCASPAYADKFTPPVAPESLANHECLSAPVRRSKTVWKLFNSCDEACTVNVSGRLMVDGLQAQLASALDGAGIALLPDFAVKKYLHSGSLVRFLPQWHGPVAPFYMAYSSKEVLTPALNSFILFARKSFSSL